MTTTEDVLKKWRELRRDLMFMRYQEEWKKHDVRAGKFFAEASEDERDELNLLMAVAIGDALAGDLLHEF